MPVRQSATFLSSDALDRAEAGHSPGVNFVTGQRVSGKLRTRYLDHLRELYEQEYFGLDELSARQDAMLLANTKEELDFLLYDLPLLPAEVTIAKPEEKKEDPYSVSTAFSISAIAAFVIALTGAFSHFASGNYGEQAIFGLSLAWMVTFGVLALVMKKR